MVLESTYSSSASSKLPTSHAMPDDNEAIPPPTYEVVKEVHE